MRHYSTYIASFVGIALAAWAYSYANQSNGQTFP